MLNLLRFWGIKCWVLLPPINNLLLSITDLMYNDVLVVFARHRVISFVLFGYLVVCTYITSLMSSLLRWHHICDDVTSAMTSHRWWHHIICDVIVACMTAHPVKSNQIKFNVQFIVWWPYRGRLHSYQCSECSHPSTGHTSSDVENNRWTVEGRYSVLAWRVAALMMQCLCSTSIFVVWFHELILSQVVSGRKCTATVWQLH